MKGRRSTRDLIRAAALIALAAFGLHQLRYLIGYGPLESGHALSAQGHGYLSALLPELIGVAIVVTGATLVASAISAPRRQTARELGRPARWLICSSALLAIFAVQETIEGIVSPGHPSGLAALTAGHGWVAVPLATLLGALTVGALGLLRGTDRTVAGKLRQPRALRRSVRKLAAPIQADPRCAAGCTLAFGFARRPPPLLP